MLSSVDSNATILPSGSTMKLARTEIPRSGRYTPIALESAPDLSDAIGKGTFLMSSLCSCHARCTYTESVLTASTSAPSLRNEG